jgi:hypothetical protein
MYTPHAHLTDEELLREVFTKSDATDMEIELACRIEYLLDHLDNAYGDRDDARRSR